MKKQTTITFTPSAEKPFYLVTCRGGVTKANLKDLAFEIAKVKEDKGFAVRVYESIKTDAQGFETMACIYYTGCPKKIVKD